MSFPSQEPQTSSISEDAYAVARRELVAQLRREGIASEEVLSVMERTPRHRFIPAEVQPLAYRDQPLPIGHGQTISQPYIVAYMTSAVLSRRNPASMRVLEIGTGSGYQAAVLAQLVSEVYTIEIIPELAAGSRRLLQELGHRNVQVRTGDGYQGWPDRSPFDAIVVTAAPPDIPPALVAQLAPGGRMCVPVGEVDGHQSLMLIEKSDTGGMSIRTLLPVRFVPMVPGGSGP